MIQAHEPARLQRLQARIAAAWEREAEAWAAAQVDDFPRTWGGRLLDRWRAARPGGEALANLQHLKATRAVRAAHLAGVQADASDAQIVQAAADMARDMARRLQQRSTIEGRSPPVAVSPWAVDYTGRALLLAAWAEAGHWMALRGLGDLWQRMRGPIESWLRRMVCERWWRRVLRRLHARAVEGTARAIGLVHKRAGCYVSDESAKRRAGQLVRNARALESVEAVNDTGQRYTLADLAARGVANREIRRHELMTRIAGFEQIARDCGHDAYFITVTCPARMHAWRTVPGRAWATEPNPRFDGTTPDDAQRHLSRAWARFRAAADRAGLMLYGFRIAEPNHDGTPHWHLLLFFPTLAAGVQRHRRQAGGADDSRAGGELAPVVGGAGRPAYRVAVRLLRRYFLHACDATEPGARKHRVKVERIDWQRGSAAGYVAKYVAKNIDGYRVEKDLYGNDCLTASRRVDAWASTWAIRQFQQVGGAPVGVWRELRRLHPEQAGAAAGVALALDAVNVAASEGAAHSEAVKRYTAAHAWATYTELQGGPRVRRRSLRLQLLREATGELGRYGEPIPARALGVVTAETVLEHRPAIGIVKASTVRRQIVAQVESERADWIIVPKGTAAAALPGVSRGARSAAPWSPVNNCTGALEAAHQMRRSGALDVAQQPLFRPQVQRVRKLGRVYSWGRGRPTPKGGREHAPTDPDS